MRREPRACRARTRRAFSGVTISSGWPNARAGLLLDLDDQQRAAAAEDEVELVAARTGVRGEQAVAAEPIVEEGAALAAVHAASSYP